VSFHPRPPKKSEGTATFPKDFELEEVAAVTDLYLCAYPLNNRNEFDSNYVSLPTNSPCARDFMERTITQVKPAATITRGCSPRKFLECAIFASGGCNTERPAPCG
jgi:hypothetical protein